MNVLLYSGPGTSASSVERMRATLRSFLALSHDVILASPQMLRDEPWPASTALIAFPGGRDIPFHESLSGTANSRIREWVAQGGKYFGICAGGYYASSRIEFEVGNPEFEVVGERELKFFPGTCKGTVYPGFVYDTEQGARDVTLVLNRTAWRDHWSQAPSEVDVYYNGGGAFHAAEDTTGACDVLARYADLPDQPAAGVYCRVGRGAAVLWGVHPEHPCCKAPDTGSEDRAESHERNRKREALFRASLCLLGMDVPDEPTPIPAIKPQLLCAAKEGQISEFIGKLENLADPTGIITDFNDRYCLKVLPDGGDDDILRLSKDIDSLSLSLSPGHSSGDASTTPAQDEDTKPLRYLLVLRNGLPPLSITPIFDLAVYFRARQSLSPSQDYALGSRVIYGEVVSSTQTLLDKNPKFLATCPTGLVSIASHQVAGRGRGGNSWLSPPGCLLHSLVLRLPSRSPAKVVFVQYLFGLAVVEAVRGIGPGYEKLGIRLKWPNDIYAETQQKDGEDKTGLERYKKIGGILVNSSYAGGDFTLVVGTGINVTVPKPTTSVNELIANYNRRADATLALLQPEELLGHILGRFEAMWNTFLVEGFEPFMDLYLNRWLHSDRVVKLERTGEAVRIVGITPDHGLLRTLRVELDSEGQEVHGGPLGGYVDLQPDSNSFDMLAGLIKVKK